MALSDTRPVQNICLKQVRVTLWICGTDQNQTEWREQPCKLQMENSVIQMAEADFVIKGVLS